MKQVKHDAIGLLGWLILSFAVSFIGAVASIQAKSFYANLNQPDWAPPGWLFGPVWTTLFILMAISAWLVWRSPVNENVSAHWSITRRTAISLYLAQLFFNALWSWLFFAWQMGGPALANLGLLWVLIIATTISFYRYSKLAAWLMTPYVAWVTFAGALNYSVWQLNPGLL